MYFIYFLVGLQLEYNIDMRPKSSYRDKILAIVKASPKPMSSGEIVKSLRLTRQMAARYLSELVENRLISKTGSTRNARYSGKLAGPPQPAPQIHLVKNLKGLEKDAVFSEISLRLNLPKRGSEKCIAILKYAFTEMLNNAIDHSGSRTVDIHFSIQPKEISFQVRDFGIGAFERVRKSFKLESIYSAAEHLLKGKQTTDPSRHSGQGIFFTSRAGDRFVLKSNGTELLVDNTKNDFFLKDSTKSKGTFVEFKIRKQTRRDLRILFNQFSNEDFEFDKNSVRVKLTSEKGLVSRSEAKRLLVGLDAYTRIEFDFRKVKSIGQGFADEVFRVFQNANPKILITYTHAEPPVAFMIERSRKTAE